jgi:hypothetical protein
MGIPQSLKKVVDVIQTELYAESLKGQKIFKGIHGSAALTCQRPAK